MTTSFKQLQETVSNYSFLPAFIAKSTIDVVKSHVFSSNPKSWDIRMSILVSLLKSGMGNKRNSTRQIKLLQSFVLPPIPRDILLVQRTITYSLKQIVDIESNSKIMRDLTLPDIPLEHTLNCTQTLKVEFYSTKTSSNKVIMYLHGGAYFCGGTGTHRMMGFELARQTNAIICMVDYRLAPEFPFPCALHDAFAAYLYLIDPQHALFNHNFDSAFEDVILMGDSAGGGLGISLMVYLKDYIYSYKMPIGGVFYSPWIDLSCSSASWTSKVNQDYLPTCPPLGYFYDMFDVEKGNPVIHFTVLLILMNQVMWYTAGKRENLVNIISDEDSGIGLIDERIEESEAIKLVLHPLVSPYYANTKDFPPMLIQSGGVELIRDETSEFVTRIHKENPGRASNFRYEQYKDMPHVFQTFFWTQSSQLAHSRAGIFCKSLWNDIEVKNMLFTDNDLVESIIGVDRSIIGVDRSIIGVDRSVIGVDRSIIDSSVTETVYSTLDLLIHHPFC